MAAVVSTNFSQAKGLTSLSYIEVSLRSHYRKWYNPVLTSVARSTIADANSGRDADILKYVFYTLLDKFRELSPKHRFKFKNPLYSFDSTGYLCRSRDREHREFVTNNFILDACIIADLYKSRWEIEMFSKRIKQNLKIKSFIGTSKNAVMTQTWAAMIYYLMLSFIKFQTKCCHSLHELTRIIGELFLDNVCLFEILTIPFNRFKLITQKQGQLTLF